MTERELLEKVTPGFIRWLVDNSTGFELVEDADRVGFMLIEHNGVPVFDLLNSPDFKDLLRVSRIFFNLAGKGAIVIGHRYYENTESDFAGFRPDGCLVCCTMYYYDDYTGDRLTSGECALLHCMMDVYEELCATAPEKQDAPVL